MNKITEIFKANKYVIIWTAVYIAIVWAILLFMFNFNIFVGHQWYLLTHAEIKGFAGFVFGILMLAALPMYIATTAVIIRTKQPLITVNIKPVIKIFTAIIPHPVPTACTAAVPTTDVAPQIAEQSAPTQPTPSIEEFPNAMPSELRGAFIRARQHVDQFAQSAFNPAPDTAPSTPAPQTNPETETSELPLPTDFNFDTPSDSDFAPSISMPTFTDISFDDDDAKSEDTNNDTSPAPTTDNDNDAVINYLTEHGYTPRRDGDMIIANNIIIATHDDPDFWIADPENWFAAGKQKVSPVTQLIKASAQQELRPVLYLAQTNIMELDACRGKWDKMGVTTITDLGELPL